MFDTTSEKVAKENNLYRENAVFRPVPVIVGHGDVLPGLDEALANMKEGEMKNVKLGAQKAFGERRKELVVVIPLQEFRKRNIMPTPGLIVDLDGVYGKVQTVSGGRVRIDMNNDLAGKEVEYEIKILKEVKDVSEQAQLLTEKFFPLREKAQVRLEGEVLKVKLPKEAAKQLAPLITPFSQTITHTIPQIKSIEIVDSFEEKANSKKESKS